MFTAKIEQIEVSNFSSYLLIGFTMNSKSLARPVEHAEYLKVKYGVGSDDSSKKSKKRKKTVVQESKKTNLRIFDDDIDLVKINVKKETEDTDIYYGVEEDKPVIEEVIDDRPLSVKNLDKKGTKWKPLGEDEKPGGPGKDNQKSNQNDDGKGKRVSHGLTSAAVMREEKKRLKEEEAALFKKLGSEISGKDAQSIYRDKKTGRVRDLEKEKKEKEAKDKETEEKEAKEKQKFKEMTAGLKQVEEKKVQMEEELHEMMKPFARYEDDTDRDQYLRSREMEGDPMLSYFRKKKEKTEETETGDKKIKLKYKGPPPPLNRFNIPPGHRWDGVDRSNGHEKKYFQRQAEKTAVQEEAYRWATEDM